MTFKPKVLLHTGLVVTASRCALKHPDVKVVIVFKLMYIYINIYILNDCIPHVQVVLFLKQIAVVTAVVVTFSFRQ